MRELISWKKCENEYVRKVEPDHEKVKSLIKMAGERQDFIQHTPAADEHVSFIVEGLYEVIKQLLTALLQSKGLRSQNHQCLISYFYQNYSEYEALAHLISQLSYLRYRLNYYGEAVEPNFYRKNKEMIA